MLGTLYLNYFYLEKHGYIQNSAKLYKPFIFLN